MALGKFHGPLADRGAANRDLFVLMVVFVGLFVGVAIPVVITLIVVSGVFVAMIPIMIVIMGGFVTTGQEASGQKGTQKEGQ
jgi:hypothetical protein